MKWRGPVALGSYDGTVGWFFYVDHIGWLVLENQDEMLVGKEWAGSYSLQINL